VSATAPLVSLCTVMPSCVGHCPRRTQAPVGHFPCCYCEFADWLGSVPRDVASTFDGPSHGLTSRAGLQLNCDQAHVGPSWITVHEELKVRTTLRGES
jgi:hypothetical protein